LDKEVKKYAEVLFHALNAVAGRGPHSERRLLPNGGGRLVRFAANRVDIEKLKLWFSDWKSAFKVASEKTGVDFRIHPVRMNYYEKAIKAMLEGMFPYRALAHEHLDIRRGARGDHFNSAEGSGAGLLGSDLPNMWRTQSLPMIEIVFEEMPARTIDVEPPTL
jgi:hypothetical protein